jgi:hypothetical protein
MSKAGNEHKIKQTGTNRSHFTKVERVDLGGYHCWLGIELVLETNLTVMVRKGADFTQRV